MSAEEIVPSRQRFVLWTLILLVLMGVFWAFVGELDIVASAEGRFVAAGNTKVIQSPQSGSVRTIFVKEGDFVTAQAPLIELDVSVHTAELQAIQEKLDQASLELARLESEQTRKQPEYPTSSGPAKILIQENLRLSRRANYQQRLGEISSVVQSRRAALDAGEATLLGLERRRDIAMVKERNAAPHVDVAITRFQYLQLKDDLTSLDKDIESQRQTNSKLRFDIQESSRKLAQVTSEYQNAILGDISDRTTMIMQLQAESDRAKKFLQDDIIRAPVDGYIQYIAVSTIGASVAPADQLMLIVPKDSPLIVEAFLSNEDRGFVRLGQDVDIKIDAFPFQKYGKLSGTLTWLSSDAEDYASATRRSPSPFAPSLASGTQRSQFVYRMRIQPRNLQLLDRSIVLSPGLSVKADIYTDKRRIIDFLLFPVQEGIETATRTR